MTPIDITGIIGVDTTAEQVRAALAGAQDAKLRIHSPGGDVTDGLDIYNAVRAHKRAGYRVTAQITGLAASMASAIAMAADELAVEDNAVLMIHNPATFAWGDYREMSKTGAILDGLARVLANAYVAKTGQDPAAIRAQMDAETWLFGDEIAAAGFADRVIPAGEGEEDATAARALAMTRYTEMQATLRQAKTPPALERISALLDLEDPPMSDPTASDPDAAPPDAAPTADPEPEPPPAAPEAIQAERARASAILARCQQARMPHLAASLIDQGASLAACNAAIVDVWVAQGSPEINPRVTVTAPSASWDAVIARFSPQP